MQLLSDQLGSEDTPIGQLYRRHWLRLFTAIRQSISSQEDAEDILLDVFLAALESKAVLGMSGQHQEAWLLRVAHNKCIDFHRRAARRPVLPLEGDIEILHDKHGLPPEKAVLRHEELRELQKHLASLGAVQQEILRLRFAEELPYTQIALRIHKSEGAIRTMLSRTLNHLRSMYTQCREESHHE